MSSVIFSDIDGTLTNNSSLDDQVRLELEKIKTAGTKLILVTGRNHGPSAQTLENFADTYIYENGAIFNPYDGQWDEKIKPESDQIMTLANNYPEYNPRFFKRSVRFANAPDFDESVYKDFATFIPSCDNPKNAFSLIPKSAGKFNAIQYFVNKHNISNFVYLGDEINDLDVFESNIVCFTHDDSNIQIKQLADEILPTKVEMLRYAQRYL